MPVMQPAMTRHESRGGRRADEGGGNRIRYSATVGSIALLQTAGRPPISWGLDCLRLQIDDTAAGSRQRSIQCDESKLNGLKLNFGFAWNSQGSFNLILAGRAPAHRGSHGKDRIDVS